MTKKIIVALVVSLLILVSNASLAAAAELPESVSSTQSPNEENYFAASQGGYIVAHSKNGQYPGEEWTNINDEDNDGCNGNVAVYTENKDSWMIGAFANDQTKTINKIRISNHALNCCCEDHALKTFRFEVSTTGITRRSFTTILEDQTDPSIGWYEFTFDPVEAKYIKFTMIDNHSGGTKDWVSMGELEIYGKDQSTFTSHSFVSLTFDDGRKSNYEYARPILAANDLTATAYIYPKAISYFTDYMTWDQVKELQNNNGWEIGSHSLTHAHLTRIPYQRMVTEVKDSKKVLENKGLVVKSFATPYGEYDNHVLAEISKHYLSHRGAWGGPINLDDFNDYELTVRRLLHTTSLSDIQNWLDIAKQNHQWLIISIHDIVEGTPGPHQYNLQDFEDMIGLIKASQLQVANISQVIERWQSHHNLVLNGSFEQGTYPRATGWKQNSWQGVKLDRETRGASPFPQRSFLFTGGQGQKEVYSLFSMAVKYGEEYTLKTWQNISALDSGYLYYWISEFDEDGKYVGGRWLGGFDEKYVGVKYFAYTPKSQLARTIRLYIYTPAGTQIRAYVDQVGLYQD